MGTIDMSQVAGFKAVDAEGNELGVVSMNELTESISEQVLQTIAMRNQATTLEHPALMSAASTLAAGNDAYENELTEAADFNWVRTLDADGNPKITQKANLASVVGGLLGNPPKYIKQDNTDCNDITTYCVVSSYKWSNAPSGASIGILEVIPYSPDWIVQRFTQINETPTTYIRSYYNAEAWSPWRVL